MDCSLPGSSVREDSPGKYTGVGIPGWVAMPSSRGSSRPRDQTHVSYSPALAGGFFITSATWDANTRLNRKYSAMLSI